MGKRPARRPKVGGQAEGAQEARERRRGPEAAHAQRGQGNGAGSTPPPRGGVAPASDKAPKHPRRYGRAKRGGGVYEKKGAVFAPTKPAFWFA